MDGLGIECDSASVLFNCSWSRQMNEPVNEPVKIVQFVIGQGNAPDLCLDDKGNLYKMEYTGRHDITLVKQVVHIVIP